MSTIAWAFDIAIGSSLLWLAWQSLANEDLLKAVTMFIIFGLVVALTWCRLHAPDIALAEAAIGAGLTGALLLGALPKKEGDDIAVNENSDRSNGEKDDDDSTVE